MAAGDLPGALRRLYACECACKGRRERAGAPVTPNQTSRSVLTQMRESSARAPRRLRSAHAEHAPGAASENAGYFFGTQSLNFAVMVGVACRQPGGWGEANWAAPTQLVTLGRVMERPKLEKWTAKDI